MRVSSRPIRAAVFDMEGVLLDSEPLHHQALNAVLSTNDRAPLSFDAFGRYLGAASDFIWDDLVHRQRMHRPVSFYRDQFDELVICLYREQSVIACGAVRLLHALKERGLALAVASPSPRGRVETCLDAIGVRSYFDAIVDGDMVANAKPDPAIYLLAAQWLDVAPQECIAVEDSARGISAAVAAGMLTVVVDTPYTRQQAPAAGHIHVHSLDELVERCGSPMSGRAVEAAGDCSTRLLDTTGSITLGNRQGAGFLPLPGVAEDRLTDTFLAHRAEARTRTARTTAPATRRSWAACQACT